MKEYEFPDLNQGGKASVGTSQKYVSSSALALEVFAELFREQLKAVIPGLDIVLPKHKKFQEADAYANAKDEAKQRRAKEQLREIAEFKELIKKSLPDELYTEDRSLSDRIAIGLIGAGLIFFPAISVTTLQDLIQANSTHGLEWASFGIAASIWVFSLGLEAAIDGALKRFKWIVELLAVGLILYWAPQAFDAIAENYGVSHVVESQAASTFNWGDEDLSAVAEEEEETEDVSLLLKAIMIGEGCGVFLLFSMLRKKLLPQLHPIRKAAEREFEDLNRKEWLINLFVPSRDGRRAASDYRKTKAEAPAEAIDALIKQFKK
ncbi:hypothetical protein MLD52_09540 [Puniceicoccaceae bacterium K14]|nr:hypothetical protein [Puniceicoccaceae bacterium K14]